MTYYSDLDQTGVPVLPNGSFAAYSSLQYLFVRSCSHPRSPSRSGMFMSFAPVVLQPGVFFNLRNLSAMCGVVPGRPTL